MEDLDEEDEEDDASRGSVPDTLEAVDFGTGYFDDDVDACRGLDPDARFAVRGLF